MSTSTSTSTSTRNHNPLRNLLTYLHRKKTLESQIPERNHSIASASTSFSSKFELKGKGRDMSSKKNGDRDGDVSEEVVHHEAIATSLALK